ncbi:het-domain protein [Fusarium tjaetaba]|uniref:Het-domain protein n=1 Tax=Fusarium tjaetaba TaxID=1567544 RepID=A0A8H5RSL1_9HYPO|nr:het-domain protein [Fusarium tjaetaba]KAF5638399.1 het-domain protein [Fusarium tjaetaba]
MVDLQSPSNTQQLSNGHDTLRRRYCNRCFDFLSNCPNLDDLTTNWALERLPQDDEGRPYLIYKYSATWAELDNASCALCKTFVDYAEKKTNWPSETEKLYTFSVAYHFKVGGGLPDVEEIQIRQLTSPTVRWNWFEAYPKPKEVLCDPENKVRYESLPIYAHPDDPSSRFVSMRTPSTSLWSQQQVTVARGWIKECDESHGHSKDRDNSKLPTRVINVSNPDTIKLYCGHPGESAPYSALSYCWGISAQPVVLEKHNLTDLVKGIKISRLPQTIIDAIQVTRQLGLKYLWLDALCIIQDSEEDKEQEIRQMARIYENAYITIAATNARNVRDGFLTATKNFMEDSGWVELPFQKLGRVYSFTSWANLIPVDDEPLNQRVWTLQEDLLSRRVLYFGSFIMYWKCGKHVYMDHWGSRILSLGNFLTPGSISWDPRRCSARKMRYGDDKLEAISAIAMEASKEICSRYIAGMWERNLEDSLLWRVKDWNPPDEGYVLPKHRGPSWSWISVDQKIDFETVYDFEAEILECNAELVLEASPFGRVIGGVLVMRGVLAKAVLGNREALWRCHQPESSYEQYKQDPENGINMPFKFDRKKDADEERDWSHTYLFEYSARTGIILEKI